jgi:hypothetical protein
MGLREAYLHDYLAASFIGVAYGSVVSLITQGAIGSWGYYIGLLFIAGLFGFIPGGFIAGYLNFRFHRTGENLEMAGLSAGFFTAIVHTIIGIFVALAGAILNTAAAGNIMIAWILAVIFAFIFYPVGGYVSGLLERRPFEMPTMFDLSRVSRAPTAPPPPPPEAAAQACPTCGQPMTFVQQYGRSYCYNCKKYA